MIASEIVVRKLVAYELLDLVFGEWIFAAQFFADEIERFAQNFVDTFAGFGVELKLGFAPAGFELLNEIGGRDDFHAGGADQFNGAGIDHGNVRNGTVGRILHGDALGAAE